jgi:hypothetical protein
MPFFGAISKRDPDSTEQLSRADGLRHTLGRSGEDRRVDMALVTEHHDRQLADLSGESLDALEVRVDHVQDDDVGRAKSAVQQRQRVVVGSGLQIDAASVGERAADLGCPIGHVVYDQCFEHG